MWLNPLKRRTAPAASASKSKRAGVTGNSTAAADANGGARKKIRNKGLQEALARKSFKKWTVRRNLYRRLGVRVANGAAIEDVLEMEAQALEAKGDHAAYVLREASRLMRNGHSLSESLKRWIPADEMGVLATSEGGNSLSDSLEYFIETRRRMHRVAKAYRNAFVQPVIYLMTVYGVLWSIAKYSVPDLASSGAASRATGLAKLLLTSSEMVNSWEGFIPPVLFLTMAYVVGKSFSRWKGPLRILAERWFPYSYYRDSEGFTWLSGHVSLLQVGQSDVDIFTRQIKYASPWLRERLLHYRRAMVNGKSLAQALATPSGPGRPAFGFPNPDIINDIAAMGDTGDFPVKMRKVLDNWAEEMEEQTLEKSKVFGFALEIAMYVIMGFLILAMNSLVNQVAVAH